MVQAVEDIYQLCARRLHLLGQVGALHGEIPGRVTMAGRSARPKSSRRSCGSEGCSRPVIQLAQTLSIMARLWRSLDPPGGSQPGAAELRSR